MLSIKRLTFILSAFLLIGVCAAGETKIDLTVKNAAITRLQTRIAGRAEKLNKWKDSGAIGEAANGLVESRAADTLALDQKKEVRDLVVAENEDRYGMFREFIAANNAAETDLGAVSTAFAKQRRDAAAAAHWVQSPKDQKWVQKKDLQE